jgi:NADH-quinone oxidoreductase subunit C
MSDQHSATDEAAISQPGPELVHGCPVTRSRGQLVVHTDAAGYLPLVRKLVDDGYDLASDLCGVDYLEHMDRPIADGVTPERFEVVVNLLDLSAARRIRVRVQVSADHPVVASLFDLYPGTEAMERETYDMFGIEFTGHPDMTRILMPEDWDGHPLRKDYAVGRIPVQFKGAHS